MLFTLNFFQETGEQTLDLMDTLLSSIDTLMDYTKSDLYEHMDFNPFSSSFAQTLIASQLKHFLEDDTYSFAKESPKWEAFKEKWTS